LLDTEPWAALGLLEALWDWAAEYAPDGAVGKWRDSVIAEGIKWRGKPARLVEILIESGWLDEVDDAQARFVIHAWAEHAQDKVRKKLERSGKTFYDGSAARQRRDSGETPTHKNDISGETAARRTPQKSPILSEARRDSVRDLSSRVAHPIPSHPGQATPDARNGHMARSIPPDAAACALMFDTFGAPPGYAERFWSDFGPGFLTNAGQPINNIRAYAKRWFEIEKTERPIVPPRPVKGKLTEEEAARVRQ